MTYTKEEVMEFLEMEDVKFVRLAFCDIFGKQKNVAIIPGELERAFSEGIAFDGSSIDGFTDEAHSDLFLFPIPSTLTILPWRSVSGKVVRMFCEIRKSDGTIFEKDSRNILKEAAEKARQRGLKINFGSECEFYLFQTDEKGLPTKIPFDNAGYMDVAPEDKGENIRREICLTLEQMDLHPENSHHEEGPGQNEIDFRYGDPLTAADNAMNFFSVVKAVAVHNGLYADFSAKPLAGESGNGLHINISVQAEDGSDVQDFFMAGILNHIKEMTAFLNPTENSYERLGSRKAPRYVSWARENRTQLIRVPAEINSRRRFELRSPDPMANPYIAYALLIYAGLDGIEKRTELCAPTEKNLSKINSSEINLERLPENLREAREIARKSEFIKSILRGNWTDGFSSPKADS